MYDAADEMLLASGTLAVRDALVVLSEYHKIELVDDTWPCGWQYINIFVMVCERERWSRCLTSV